MDSSIETPIFPLGTVLYPAGWLPLRIFEPRYVEMTKACLRDDTPFGVTLIRAGFEVGMPAIPCEVGCTARIIDWSMPAANLSTLTTQGESLFRIRRRRTQADGLIMASVELLNPPDPVSLPSRYGPLKTLLQRLVEEIGETHLPTPSRLDDAAWVSYRLCELLPVAPERKQQLLETTDSLTLLDALTDLIRALREEP